MLRYEDPTVLGFAWWTPAVFAAFGLAMAFSDGWLARIVPQPPRLPATPFALGASAAWLVLFYAASAAFKTHDLTLALAFGAVFSWRWWRRPRRADGLHALLAAATGVSIAHQLSQRGGFGYTVAAPWGVPLWLPVLYLFAAFVAQDLTREWQLK